MTEKPKQVEDSTAKDEKEVLEAVEAHVNPDDTEIPDHSAQRKVEAHRQAQVGTSAALDTGDDSAVLPQPDRDAPGEPTTFAPLVEGERQVTEQPDRYAVGDEAAEYAVEANSKNRRGRRKKKDDADAEAGEAPAYPAQYEGDIKDTLPAQYSW